VPKFYVASLQPAQQLRLIERVDAPVAAGSHPIQAKTALDGDPGVAALIGLALS